MPDAENTYMTTVITIAFMCSFMPNSVMTPNSIKLPMAPTFFWRHLLGLNGSEWEQPEEENRCFKESKLSSSLKSAEGKNQKISDSVIRNHTGS